MNEVQTQFLELAIGHLRLLRANRWQINLSTWLTDAKRQWKDHEQSEMPVELEEYLMFVLFFFRDMDKVT